MLTNGHPEFVKIEEAYQQLRNEILSQEGLLATGKDVISFRDEFLGRRGRIARLYRMTFDLLPKETVPCPGREPLSFITDITRLKTDAQRIYQESSEKLPSINAHVWDMFGWGSLQVFVKPKGATEFTELKGVSRIDYDSSQQNVTMQGTVIGGREATAFCDRK